MKIETIEIHNYKVLQNVKIENIGSIAVFLGENSVGKSTLFDVFGFLKTCLTENVHSALHARGGYGEVHTRDAEGDISFVFKYRTSPDAPIFVYELHIGLDKKNEAAIKYETMYCLESENEFCFIRRNNYIEIAKKSETGVNDIFPDRGFGIESQDVLALDIIGQMAEYKTAVEFRKYIEDWFIFDFQLNSAQQSQNTTYIERLNRNANNLASVARFIKKEYPEKFNAILDKMRKYISGMDTVDAKTTEDGRILLHFFDGRFKDPFAAQFVSDGTIKMFTYLVMLADPTPHMLLCIEEPENQLYPHLLEILCEEFREYAIKGGQVFISTHSPDFVNALDPTELFFIIKKDSGYSEIKLIAENSQVVDLFDAGDKLGWLWTEGLLERKP